MNVGVAKMPSDWAAALPANVDFHGVFIGAPPKETFRLIAAVRCASRDVGRRAKSCIFEYPSHSLLDSNKRRGALSKCQETYRGRFRVKLNIAIRH